MPKQINTYTFGSALVKKFGLKGRFQPVLDEVIVPVTLVDESEAGQLAIGNILGAASGAGNQHLMRFQNPEGSGVLAVITHWWAVSGAPLTDFISTNLRALNLSLAGTRIWRDSSQGIPRCGFNDATPASAVLTGPNHHLDSDSIVWEEEWRVLPGWSVEFRQNAANQTLELNALWTETPLTVTNAP